MNEENGTLYDGVPQVLTGNMINTSDPGKPVLGNFQVSGGSEKRIFISRGELPSYFHVTTEFEFCQELLVNGETDLPLLDSLLGAGWVGMDTIPHQEGGGFTYNLVNSRVCFNCMSAGGKVEPPDYW